MSSSIAAHAEERRVFSVIEQVREGFAQVAAVLLVFLPVFGIITQYGNGVDVVESGFVPLYGATVLTGLFCVYLTYRKQIGLAGMIIAGVLVASAMFSPEILVRTFLSVLAVIVASTLTGQAFFWVVLAFVVGLPVIQLIEELFTHGMSGNVQLVDTIILFSTVTSVAAIFRYFYGVAKRTSETAEESYQRLVSIALVGRQTSRLLNYTELIDQSVNLIKQQFGFYHVQIFLVDEKREYAVLVASTGEAGRRLLARNHKLGIGSQSVIGRTTLANEAVLINDTENEPGHAFNPLLPETRAELALPMQVQTEGGIRVAGALDVQSEIPMAFSLTDVQALQALANQLAVAIRNAQLFEAQEQSLHENEDLFHQAQHSLDEIRRLNSQLTRDSWDGFVGNHLAHTGVSVQGDTVAFNTGWTPAMLESCETRATISRKGEDGVRITATPMMLRDEIVGAVEVVGGDEDEINLVEAIVAFTERFAVALENVRLVEEAQTASAQEQRISAVVSRFQEAETVDELLQITLTELADTFDADRGSIRVGIPASGQAAR